MDMALVAFYLEKGFDPEKILNLKELSKLFYIAVMEKSLEKEKWKMKCSNPFLVFEND